MSQEIRARMLAVCDKLDGLESEVKAIQAQMDDLEKQGIICARLHWRKDKPGALELLYSSNSEYAKRTGRRRQYIGKDPQKQEQAKASIQRWKEHKQLGSRLNLLERIIMSVDFRVSTLEGLVSF